MWLQSIQLLPSYYWYCRSLLNLDDASSWSYKRFHIVRNCRNTTHSASLSRTQWLSMYDVR